MIIKSLTRKSNSFSQLIRYVCRYVLRENNGQNTNDVALVLRHNLRSHNVDGYIKEFVENELYRLHRRKDSVKLFHTILSFSPTDKEHISSTVLRNVVKQYISLRGENSLYLAAAHHEKSHCHIHVVHSGVQTNGRSGRISKEKFKSIKLALEEYSREKYPQLLSSNIEHGGRSAQKKKEAIQIFTSARQTQKRMLLALLDKAYVGANSFESFLQQLKNEHLQPYFRNGQVTGLLFEGRKYRFSRLGYNTEILEALKDRHKQVTATEELQQLRKGIKQEQCNQLNFPVKNKEQEALAELSAIRKMLTKRSLMDERFIHTQHGFEERK